MDAVTAFVVLGCLWLVLVLIVGLHALSKADVPVSRGEARCCRVLTAAPKLGAKIMSVVDAALARFSAFVTGVLAQVKVAKETNDAQTAKLAELQAALDAAKADDDADAATIANLQAEVSNLQNKVADQINAAIDALENPPVEAPVEEPVVEEVVVEEAAPVEEAPEAPVE